MQGDSLLSLERLSALRSNLAIHKPGREAVTGGRNFVTVTVADSPMQLADQ